jgi:hypothetical protein
MLPLANVLPILDRGRNTKGFLNEMCMDSQSTAYLEKIIIVSINHYHVAADEFQDIALVYYELARSVRRFTKS